MPIVNIGFDISRRGVMASTAALGLAFGLSGASYATDTSLDTVAEDAAIWGFPLVLIGRYLQLSKAKQINFNQFYLNQALATPALKVGGPNVDTIYGFAWLDLSQGPIVLTVPEANDRYYSIQFIDAYANSFAYVGRRETGTHAGTYVLATKDQKGTPPANAKRIIAPSSLVFVLTRTLVKGEDDLEAAQSLQASYGLGPLSAYPDGQKVGIVEDNALNILPVLNLSDAGASYFDELSALVAAYPPTGQELIAFNRFKSLGLGTKNPAYKHALSETRLKNAFDSALKRIKSFNSSENQNGWWVNFNISKFVKDPLARAAFNTYGPGGHIAEEALYFSAATDAEGKALSGQNSYQIVFPKDKLPPVNAFWSLILYDSNFYLFDNPLNRYTINDRTDGLIYGQDGSLKIVISATKPDDPNANWLPAPSDNFRLLLRTYQPRPEILDHRYKLPPLLRL